MTDAWEPGEDDIKAMRHENGGRDLKAFMRAQIAAGQARRDEPAVKPPPARPPTLRRPGAWPEGTGPSRPKEWDIPAHIWQAAMRHRSNEIHRPDQPCDCGYCPTRLEEIS